ncbi:transcriptional regulator [Prauserella marina]|nr:metalloregulator ArsR/SmtB family transcription factor [Prauserella marina]ASR34959.1 transcriptional regulator [Prauserella marina]
MDVMDALGDPTRRRIVEVLSAGSLNSGAIAAHFPISRPAVSQHLRVLAESGIVTVHREGTRQIYTLDPASLDKAGNWLEAQRRRWSGSLDALEKALDSEEE